jgi:hypothetical protein
MESRQCLVSGRTDSITRWSSSELLTVHAMQYHPIGQQQGLGDAVQSTNALSVAVLQQEHRAGPIPRPRELDQLAQARW